MPRKSAASRRRTQTSSSKSRVRVARSSSSSSKQSKSRKQLYIGIGAGVILLLFVAFPLWFNLFVRQDVRIPEVTQKMTTYLEGKYDQSFEVSDVRYVGFGLGMEGNWQAKAHPKNDSSLTFQIGSDNDTTIFSDQYKAAIWSSEQTKLLAPEIKRIYGDTSTRTTASVKIVTLGDLLRAITKSYPTFEQARDDYPDELGYNLQLNTSDVDPSALLDESNKAYTLIEFIRNNKIKTMTLEYKVKTNSGGTYQCNLNTPRLAEVESGHDIEGCLRAK